MVKRKLSSSVFIFIIAVIFLIGLGWYISGRQGIGQIKTKTAIVASPIPTVDAMANRKTYSNTSYGFKIEYPATWTNTKYVFSNFAQGNLFSAAEEGTGSSQEGGLRGFIIAVPIKTDLDAVAYTKEKYFSSDKITSDSDIVSEEVINNHKFTKLTSCSLGCYYFFSIKNGSHLFSFVFLDDEPNILKILSTFKFTNWE